ncbi:hypothetical protein [Streptomyces sp. NPDC002343]
MAAVERLAVYGGDGADAQGVALAAPYGRPLGERGALGMSRLFFTAAAASRRLPGVMAKLSNGLHEEVLAVIDAVAEAPPLDSAAPITAFGASCWGTCSVASGVVEVLDAGSVG